MMVLRPSPCGTGPTEGREQPPKVPLTGENVKPDEEDGHLDRTERVDDEPDAEDGGELQRHRLGRGCRPPSSRRRSAGCLASTSGLLRGARYPQTHCCRARKHHGSGFKYVSQELRAQMRVRAGELWDEAVQNKLPTLVERWRTHLHRRLPRAPRPARRRRPTTSGRCAPEWPASRRPAPRERRQGGRKGRRGQGWRLDSCVEPA